MSPWGLAKKSVKLFLNFSFGQFLSQPLEDEQIIITSNGIGCKDIYFNTDVAEILVCLPWSVELNGIDFVIQAISGAAPCAGSDDLFNSMISSVTTAAFAAAKAANNTSRYIHRATDVFDEEDEYDLENQDSNEAEKLPGGLKEQAYQFLENLTNVAENINISTKDASSFVDQGSKERIAHMIDSLIAQTSVVLRDVSIRIECQLKLPGLDRASGITLCVEQLSISNQYKSEEKLTAPPPSGGRWSWLWWWQSPQSDSQKEAKTSASSTGNAGSLSTMLHKIIHLEELNLFWDLWDTSRKSRRCRSTLSNSSDEEIESSFSTRFKTRGPTANTLVASAKLLTLSGKNHSARVSLRVGSLNTSTGPPNPTSFGSGTSPIPMQSNPNHEGGSGHVHNYHFRRPTSLPPPPPNISSLSSDFQLRLHIDLGPLVACACPSQFYWVHMVLGQLGHIYEDYLKQNDHSNTNRSVNRTHSAKLHGHSTVIDTEVTHRQHTFGNDNIYMNSEFGSTNRYFQNSNKIIPFELSESQLVDLDLSKDLKSHPHVTSEMLNSDLFRSCITDISEVTLDEEVDFNYPMNSNKNFDERSEHSMNVDTKFSLSANLLCVAFVVFYEDESVLNTSRRECRKKKLPSSSSSLLLSFLSTQPDHNQTSVQFEVDDEPVTIPGKSSPFDGDNSEHYIPGATLPGPSIFFTRFHGHMPWGPDVNMREQSKECMRSEEENVSEKYDPSQTCDPRTSNPKSMCIDRTAVDTGQMTPNEWIDSLKRQFAYLAYPRDHLWLVITK